MISSPAGGLTDLERACVEALGAAGRGRPAWVVDTPEEAARREAVDYALDFSDRRRGAFAPIAPFGVWRFEFDGGDPPGWRAMTAGDRAIDARLIAEVGDDGAVVLQQGALPTAFGYRGLRAQLVHVLSSWPPRAVAEIDSGGWALLPPRIDAPRFRTGGRSWLDRLKWSLAFPARGIWRWWHEAARYDTWNVGIAVRDRPLAAIQELHALGPIRWLPPRPPRYFLADPFPFHRNGRRRLLVEDYGHPRGVRGRIACVDLDEDPPAIVPAMTRARHISYPFTFEDAGRIRCAVEMSQEDGCAIYELDDQDRWIERCRILRGLPLVDPTFFRAADRWWLFCTDTQGAGSLTLHAFHSQALEGPWTPHGLNPLKSDLRSARAAGRPFVLGARLFRPAQDCSATYGGAINVMEIVELTPTRFREVLATRLEPDPGWPYPDGMHTLVVDGDRVYIDAKRERYDYFLWLKNLRPSHEDAAP